MRGGDERGMEGKMKSSDRTMEKEEVAGGGVVPEYPHLCSPRNSLPSAILAAPGLGEFPASVSHYSRNQPLSLSGQWPPGSEHPDLGKQVYQGVELTEAWQVTSAGSEEEGSARLSIYLQPVGGKHCVLHGIYVEMEATDVPLPRLHLRGAQRLGAGVSVQP